MGRNPISRMVSSVPCATFYKPRGVPLRELEISTLTVDEYEAVRLADYESLEQAEAGERMGVSRQTFARIVRSARNKVADALINGKAICIEGGPYQICRGQGCGGRGRGRGRGCRRGQME